MTQQPRTWVLVAALLAVTWTHGTAALEPSGRGANSPRQNQDARTLVNPVPSTPASIAIGKKFYDGNCAACHGNAAEGAVRAGTPLPALDGQNGRQPPNLTDDQWDHGSSDGDIFTTIKGGLPPTMMPGFEGGIADIDIWSVVNYVRSLRQQGQARPGTNGGRR